MAATGSSSDPKVLRSKADGINEYKHSNLDLSHIIFAGPHSSPGGTARQLSRPRKAKKQESVARLAEEEVVRSILTRAGLNPFAYSLDSLLRRLPACMRALKAKSPADCVSALSVNPDLTAIAVSTLLVGVTEFFRDPAVFDALRTQVLPVLTRRLAHVRVWSVGCSNGAELYTVAILLADMNLLERCVLLGTDCRKDAIEQALRAEYAKSNRLDPDIVGRYFEKSGNDRVKPLPVLRDHIQWRVADALNVIEPGPWDLVLCRNMAIYFKPEAAMKFWRRVAEAIRPGGFLMTGKAEQWIEVPNLIHEGRSLYRKRGKTDDN